MYARASQVEIAILEANFFSRVDFIFDEKGGCWRGIEGSKLVAIDLNRPGGQFAINHSFGAGFYHSLDGDNKFAAQLVGFL